MSGGAEGAGRRRGQPVSAASAFPRAASVAVAEMEAAAFCVRPQRLNEGTQDAVDVVSENNALLLKCGGRGGDGYTHTHTHTHTHTDSQIDWFSHIPCFWQILALPTEQPQLLRVTRSLRVYAPGLSALTHTHTFCHESNLVIFC